VDLRPAPPFRTRSAVGIGVAVFGIWLGLEWALPGTSATSTLPTSLAVIPAGLAVVWLLVRVLGSVITVPMAEDAGVSRLLASAIALAQLR
jgi:hypothetical protein